jgi:hypothetical protein
MMFLDDGIDGWNQFLLAQVPWLFLLGSKEIITNRIGNAVKKKKESINDTGEREMDHPTMKEAGRRELPLGG